MSADTPKLLIVLRHAKSAWPDVPDHDRPLADRGRRDAPEAGRWLNRANRRPDRVICSTARRARETWSLAAAELDSPPPVDHDKRVYAADYPDLLRVLAETPDEVTTLALVGHEPGVRELTLYLTGAAIGDARTGVDAKFPTSALAVLAVPGPWSDLQPESALLTDFVIPRG